MIDTKALSALFDIADRAIALDAATQKRRRANENLRQAYKAWKTENRKQEFMPADSPDIENMRAATQEEHVLFCETKQAEGNARKRLQTAIRRYQLAMV